MSNGDNTNWGKLFSFRAMRELAAYLTSYNMANQTVALDANAQDLQTTGTGSCMIDGVFIPSLAADDPWDWSAESAGDLVGETLADGYDQYIAILAKADGSLEVFAAGDPALVGTAVLKIPAFDPATYCLIALALVVNDSGGGIVWGTTALTGDITFYPVTGPVFPHIDNLDKN